MRFHHSTRRGRNRLSQQSQNHGNHRASQNSFSTSRWSQLGYCRETNIHFNRRIPVDPPSMTPPVNQLQTSEIARWSQPSELRSKSNSADSTQVTVVEAPTNNLSLPEDQIQERLRRLAFDDISDRSSQQRHQTSPRSAIHIDLDSAREKLLAQVEKHPFWSNRAARRMQLTHIEQRKIHIYELVSFCERRELEWRFEPYRGGLVNSIAYKKVNIPGTQTASLPGTPSRAHDTSHRQMPDLTQLVSANSFRYKTDSSSCSLYEPVSAIERPVPSAEFVWSVEVAPQMQPEPFTGCFHCSELPNSSFVKRCHGCQGRGRIKCHSCHGAGYEVCISCSGKGTTRNSSLSASSALHSNQARYSSSYYRNSPHANGYDCDNEQDQLDSYRNTHSAGHSDPGSGSVSSWVTESCHFCHGAGQKRCWVCAGKSYNPCLGCLGAGQIRCFLNLIVSWINHRDESVLNNSDNIIPRERLRLSTGLLIVDTTSDRLRPIGRSDVDASIGKLEEVDQLHMTSKMLLEQHNQTFFQERLIKQRHKITQIDCFVVNYEWKQKRGHFVIYGDEKKVYIAKYPFKSICNIT